MYFPLLWSESKKHQYRSFVIADNPAMSFGIRTYLGTYLIGPGSFKKLNHKQFSFRDLRHDMPSWVLTGDFPGPSPGACPCCWVTSAANWLSLLLPHFHLPLTSHHVQEETLRVGSFLKTQTVSPLPPALFHGNQAGSGDVWGEAEEPFSVVGVYIPRMQCRARPCGRRQGRDSGISQSVPHRSGVWCPV